MSLFTDYADVKRRMRSFSATSRALFDRALLIALDNSDPSVNLGRDLAVIARAPRGVPMSRRVRAVRASQAWLRGSVEDMFGSGRWLEDFDRGARLYGSDPPALAMFLQGVFNALDYAYNDTVGEVLNHWLDEVLRGSRLSEVPESMMRERLTRWEREHHA